MNPFVDTTRPLLYAILDAGTLGTSRIEDTARGLVALGVDLIQYRDKGPDEAAKAETLRALVRLARDAATRVLANDDPDLAALAGAHGVHVGPEDAAPARARTALGEHSLIGLSTHTLDEVARAGTEPIDYVAFGPVFASPTKPGRPARGLDLLAEACRIARVPVVAIGGITPERVGGVLEAGARGIAAISALYRGGTLDGCRSFLEAMRHGDPDGTE